VNRAKLGAGRYGAELEVAIAAVRAASRVCRAVRASLTPEQAVTKADLSPVTVADLAAEAVISLALSAAFPADPLMGEEDGRLLRDPAGTAMAGAVVAAVTSARPGVGVAEVAAALDRCSDEGGPNRRWWTLDPVDGTKGYLRNEQYAVALALVIDGEVVLGVLGCPNLPLALDSTAAAEGGDAVGCVFAAEIGGGAWQLPLDPRPDGAGGAGWRVGVADVTDPSQARYAESVEAAHSAQDVAARVAERLSLTTRPVRMDSQAKYAVVARGEASIYLRVPHGDYRENVWDHAAGAIVIREAGGVVSDVHGLPLDFTTGRRLTRNRGIIAAPAAIHPQVVAAVRSVLAER
jgi:HAL2 family 3'(2'),5'-bisphosphate nucleotidase